MENKLNPFYETASDFFHFLTEKGNVNSHTRTNYMSWLYFLSKYYEIDVSLTTEKIANIIKSERNARFKRNIYTTEKDLTNFASALRKYLNFIYSNYTNIIESETDSEIEHISNDNKISSTERTDIIKSRVGQGLFRNKLINYWRGCSVSSFKRLDILVASHIKPWRNSNNNERLDVYNGLLLLPNYDKLFDKGYISFNGNGNILLSRYIDKEEMSILHINKDMHLIKIEESHKKYLQYHNEYCFIG